MLRNSNIEIRPRKPDSNYSTPTEAKIKGVYEFYLGRQKARLEQSEFRILNIRNFSASL